MTQPVPPATDLAPADRRAMLRRRVFLGAAALQFVCLAIFLVDVLSEFGPASADMVREWLGIAALATGLAVTLREYVDLSRRNRALGRTVRAASGAFQTVLDEHFAQWGLTAAERDVALLTVKGLSNAEIAAIRTTRPGTIKAQTAAIYRKAGVGGRAELVSVVIEDLIAGIALDLPPA